MQIHLLFPIPCVAASPWRPRWLPCLDAATPCPGRHPGIMDSCSTDESCSAFSPVASQRKPAAASGRIRCDGVTFTVTEGGEVAKVAGGDAAPRALGSESFFDAGTGTRHQFRGRPRPCCSWSPCVRTSTASSPSTLPGRLAVFLSVNALLVSVLCF